jgi:hypothetical protein
MLYLTHQNEQEIGMRTMKTIPALMLAASLGAGMIMVSEAAFARNSGHQEHSDNQDHGLTVTSDKPGTITVSNGDPSHSVTLPGGSVTISGGQALNTVAGGPGVQVVTHPNGDFVAAANAPVPPPTRTTVTGGPEGGFFNALGNGLVDTGKDIVGTLNPEVSFKATVQPQNVTKDPPTSTSVQR